MKRNIGPAMRAASWRHHPRSGGGGRSMFYRSTMTESNNFGYVHPLHHSSIEQNRLGSVQTFWSMLSPILSSSAQNAGQDDESRDKSKRKTALQMPARQQETGTMRPRDCDGEIAQRLGCSKGEALDSATWIKAQACILAALDDGDFHLAFEFLDRLALDPNAREELNSEIINLVVEQWLDAYGKYQRSKNRAAEFTSYMHSPMGVWRKLESYLHGGISLESRTLHRVIESTALVKSKRLNAALLAETILETMLDLSRHRFPEIRPSFYTFNAVIASWEAAAAGPKGTKEAPERAWQLLERLKGLYAAGWGDDFMPDRNTYRRVMNLYSHTGDGDRVESLLEELYGLYLDHGHKSLLPTTPLFSLVLYAWSKSKDPLAMERASTILDCMLELEKTQELPGFKVTAFCFNLVMVCCSKQKTLESAEKAQKVYDDMVALSKTDPSKAPIPGSYAALVHNWSFWNPKRAEDIFWEWNQQHKLGKCDMRMDAKLISSLIAGWFYSKDPNSAKRCDKLLQYALEGNFGDSWEPSIAVFNMTINAYCRVRNIKSAERAEEILDQMKDLARKDPKYPSPMLTSYAPVIHSLTRLGRVEKAEALLRECFENRMSSLGSTNANYEKEESILSSSKGTQLNTKTFNRVLKAWLAKAPVVSEAPDRAENLLLLMNDWGVKPNIASFKYVLECRKRSLQQQRDALEQKSSTSNDLVLRANRILALLDSEYEAGALNTDESSYLSTRRDWALATVS